MQVNTNGVLSFGRRFTQSDGYGQHFTSLPSPHIVAPFWDDVNIGAILPSGHPHPGTISYRIVSDQKILDQVQLEILEHYPVLGGAHPLLVFVATWDNVALDRSNSFARNSFQVYIATDGTWTVVRFSYGNIEWATRVTLIGVSDYTSQRHITHPASFNSAAARQLSGSSVYLRIDDSKYVHACMHA